MTHSTPVLLAAGTYTRTMPHVDGKGAGLHLLEFDPASAELREVHVTGGLDNPSYLDLSADHSRLYSVREVGAELQPGIDVFELQTESPALRHLQRVETPGEWPCHIMASPAGDLLAVANYLSGEVVVLALNKSGLVQGEPVVLRRTGQGPNEERQEGPHAHCARLSPDGRHLYLTDLGVDQVLRHLVIDGRVQTTPDLVLPTVPGQGPRHIAFTPSGKHMLVNYELSSSLALFRLHENGDVARLGEVSTLPADFRGDSGDGGLRVHPSGRFVYVGNRGHDSVFAARLDEEKGCLIPIDCWPAGGRTPRDLAITPDGGHLLCASQDDALIRIFRIDPQSGALQQTGQDYPINNVVCLRFVAPTGASS